MIQPDGEAVDLPAFVAQLKDGAATSKESFAWTGPRTLATGRNLVCWWRPAGPASIFVKGKPEKVWLPALVFTGGSHRRVWVVPNKRPDRRTVLRITVWSNTYSDGGICWGNGAVPDSLSPDEWESAFFASSFDSLSGFKTKPYAITKHKAWSPLGATLEALSKTRD